MKIYENGLAKVVQVVLAVQVVEPVHLLHLGSSEASAAPVDLACSSQGSPVDFPVVPAVVAPADSEAEAADCLMGTNP